MKFWTSCLALALSTPVLISCSVGKDASATRKTTESLKNTTEDMNETTKKLQTSTAQMSQTTEALNAKTEHLAKRTDDLESELVNKESYAMTTMNLDNLFNRTAVSGQDSQLNSETDMLIYAGAAVHSMLFQYWKGDFNETLDVLDERFRLAIEILFVRCLKHIPRTFEVNPLSPNDSYKAIASLGAKLEEQSLGYQTALANAKLEKLSLYDVVMMGLRGRGQMERAEKLPKAAAMVLRYKQEAIYMMQLRHNYLPMMVLTRMSDFQDQSLAARLQSLILGQTVDLGIADGLSPSSADEEQLKEWTKWLNNAVETRVALKAMGIQPEFNQVFVKTLKGVNYEQAKILAIPLASATPRQKLLREFTEAWAKVMESAVAVPPVAL